MIVRLLGNVLLALGVLFVLFIFAPGLPPHDVAFVNHPEDTPVVSDGPWTKNDLLDGHQLLSSSVEGATLGYLKGAESFATYNGYLYSGVQGGDILRLPFADPLSGQWEFVTKFGQTCEGLHEEKKCGRVLGIHIDDKGVMVAADAYHGLYRLDLNTGTKALLVPADLPVDGQTNALTNSVAVTKDGKKIYYTTSSTHFGLSDGMYECLAEPSGRALEYDVATNTSKVVLTGLSFANGVALSTNEDFLLVGDTCGKAVWKYHVSGPDQGKSEVIAKMPGFVDNLKPNGKGGFIVGIVITSFPDQPNPIGILRSRWYLSKFVTRLLVLVQKALQFVTDNIYKNRVLQLLDHKIGNTEYMGADISPLQALIAEIDGNGKIMKTWHGTKISKICEGFVHDGFMYLGSPYNTYIARVPYDSKN